ncbi:MAG: NAD(P)/FAD-dependent oxidoreductase [Candidatus Aenigmatarchaeota archaeon]|nr:MAG: NAD(P)/FAD-dependent oxidoreductase [Candidatus Aenigmarchaeota archaeon]
MQDVIIIGAGPVGLYLAKRLEKRLRVLVIEEDKNIGKPVHCSGLVSKNLFRFVKQDRAWIEHEVNGALIHAPNGKKLRLKKRNVYVINRAGFDKHLANQISSRIMKNTRAKRISIKDTVKVETNKGVYESRILVGCDGSNSMVARHFNAKPRETMNGIIAITRERNHDDFVELWFDKRVTDGVLWKIPRGRKTEYGGMGNNLKFNALKEFFGLKDFEKRAGRIPMGPPKTYFNHCLLVGDAAAQIKPWSGGGLVYGLTCADIAAENITKAFKRNDFSESFLKRYEQEWKKRIGGRIKAGMLARGMLKRMNNAQISLALSSANRVRFLMNKLDMDYLVK